MANTVFKLKDWFDEKEFDRQILTLDKPNSKSIDKLRKEAGYKASD